MSETTELRIDDRPLMENGEEHPGSDPQADIRTRIAEGYEQRRLAEMREQHEAHGLPTPEIADFAEEPAPAVSPARHHATDVQQPVQQPQLVPMALPDGRVTYVTPDQYSQLAALGISALARSQSAPPPQQHYAPPPPPRSAFSEERAGSIAQRLSFGTIDEQKAAVMDLADSLRPEVDVDTLRRQAATDAIQHIRLEQNLRTIGEEYPEIFQDPVLTQVAALQLDQLRRNPQWQASRFDLDQYREACNQVRYRFQPARASQQQAPVAPRQTVLDRKRSAPAMPSYANARMTADSEDAPSGRPQTASETIAWMRKTRGQIV